MYAGDSLIGMAEEGHNTFYRHYLINATQTVEVTLTRIAGKGYPSLMVKTRKEETFPNARQANSYDWKEITDSETPSVTIRMTT